MLLSGATPKNGGTEASWYAAELLLAALNTCATSLLHAAAEENGLVLQDVVIAAESERHAERPDHYSRVHLHFHLEGVTQGQAADLVAYFKANCPIFGTVSRGAPTSTSVSVAPAVTS